MTKEKAITIIESHKAHWQRLLREKICDETEGKETIESFAMAISALSDYDKMQKISLDLAFENDELMNKSRWIPVSERLPEERQSVLVWCPERRNIYCACLEKEQWWIFGAFMKVQDEVVAWMPLPEPYKAEKEVTE